MPKYYEPGAVPVTFAQMREAYLKLGLAVQEMPVRYGSSPVKYLHDGVPYVLDCYHDLEGISSGAAKFYLLLERHHAAIKQLYDAWQPLCDSELTVMSGGGLQLQAFFSAKGRYQGILYLSLIDDGRFDALQSLMREHGVPFQPYSPGEPEPDKDFTLDADVQWFEALPDVPNIRMRHQKTYAYREPRG